MVPRKLIPALLALAFLGGCGNAPGVYNLPVHNAYERLAANALKDFRTNEGCGILIQFVPAAVPDRSVTWAVMSEGEEQFQFTANLTPVGSSRTKVDVDILKDTNGHEYYDGSRKYFRPAVMQPARPRIEEAIAAILEDRPYDLGHVKDAGWDDICGIQRGKIQSGDGAFSIHDVPGQY
jgi:hypothetical protein